MDVIRSAENNQLSLLAFPTVETDDLTERAEFQHPAIFYKRADGDEFHRS